MLRLFRQCWGPYKILILIRCILLMVLVESSLDPLIILLLIALHLMVISFIQRSILFKAF